MYIPFKIHAGIKETSWHPGLLLLEVALCYVNSFWNPFRNQREILESWNSGFGDGFWGVL